ncbi:MAG: phosphoserine phosphatase SerB [Gammaproteobacteria bacterium]|nr:MAG: phosphoserine phosphatase SerB [Gammaproteobacteria bacterium]
MADSLAISAITARTPQVFDLHCPSETTLTPELRDKLYHLHCDFALQAENRPEKKFFISDMDATMVVGETIDEMAEVLGIGEKISAITARAMRGELDFEEALAERLALMKGIPKTTVVEMAKAVTVTPGAKQLLDDINRRQMDSCLISGGFSEFTEQVSQRLGFKRHKANQLAYDKNDTLSGTWTGELVNADVKVATLKQRAAAHQLDLSQTVAIGDGANDSLMIAAAGLGIAYYGKPILREVANAEIHSGDMANVVHFL